ncbi:MAG: glucosaminidase domain-containing protein [Chitinophagaceae bacterium]
MHKKSSIPMIAPTKWRKILLAIFVLALFQPVLGQSKYIKKFRPLADSLAAEYEIPAAVILGVAIIESGSGTSRNSKLLNNHFGIVGKNDLMKTKGVRSRYKQYPSSRASYIAFCKLVKKKKFYDKLKGNKDYMLWLDAMSNAGYSEAPVQWKERISAAIKKNKLSATH